MTLYRVYFRRRAKDSWPNEGPKLIVKGKNELERVLGRKTPIAIAWEKAKLHKCDGCGRRGPWESGWAWRGDWKAIDEGRPISIACRPECRGAEARSFWSDYEPLPSKDRAKRRQIGLTEADRAQLIRDRRSVPLPEGWKGAGWCRWCGGQITGRYAKQRNWHPDCKRIWALHSDRDVQTRYLAHRDGLDCWDCKAGGQWWRIDLVLMRYPWESFALCLPPARIDFSAKLKDAGRKVDGVIIGLYSKVEWRLNCGPLEVDHEIPLWKIWHLPDDERKPFYGPTNIRLRCSAKCHKAKSKREAAERAQLKAENGKAREIS